MFDWSSFLEQHGVEYHPGTRGNVEVQCPFCGAADAGHHHMSISLEGLGWKCWRDRDHRGRSPVSLIRALIGCTAQEAARIAGAPLLPGSQGLHDQVASIFAGDAAAPAADSPLRELPEFKKFTGLPSGRPHLQYMRSRGFTEKFLRRASEEAGLRYCTRGAFGGRVIFLVHQEGRLVGWTGRAISPRARLRYRALSADPEAAVRDGLPPAALSIERCLLWYDELLRGGPRLELVEGPMDALKLRMLGRQATCLFTKSPSRWQVDLLRELAPRFERCDVLLDRGAEAETLSTARTLAALGFRAAWLPAGVADPGELTAAHAP